MPDSITPSTPGIEVYKLSVRRTIDRAIRTIDAGDFSPDEVVTYSRQLDFKRQFKKEVGKAPFYFDDDQAVSEKTDRNIKGAKLGMKYKDLKAAILRGI